MQDFTKMTAEQALEQLNRLGRAKRDKAIRQLIYKKAQRPVSRTEQLRLLEMFHHDDTLARFERTYALVAATHKASESLDTASLNRFLPALSEALAWAKTLPMRKELRKDGLHMRFSILNVLINAAVLLGREDRHAHAEDALACLRDINPRKTTHYTFNSTTNILNTLGVALLVKPSAFADTIDVIRALLYHSIRMKFAGDWPALILPQSLPLRLAEVTPPSNFIKFEESFRKFLSIKSAADLETDTERQALFWEIAKECVSQSTQEQKQAHLDAVSLHLSAHWTTGT
jgi:hypothetical protein